MIADLPLEIQIKLLRLCPSSQLKHINSHFYMLYNNLYYDKIIHTFGEDIVYVIIRALPWLKVYIHSLDAFRFTTRNIIASRLGLLDIAPSRKTMNECCRKLNPVHANEILCCQYIKDSWKYIYSVLKNKRLYAEYTDYKIDEPTNYVFNHFVEINRTYLLSYAKALWLAPGQYNLNIGLVIKHGSGLGTTKFEIKYENHQGQTIVQTFYPPTNINDILPKQQFCLLRLGEFTIPPAHSSVGTNDCNHHNKLYKVQLVMEEIGLYLKSGFRIYFIDISQPSLLFNEFDLLYYTVKETDYKLFINLPLKNLYKALNYIQNGGVQDQLSKESDQERYGAGDPFENMDLYDQKYLVAPEFIDDDEEQDMAHLGSDLKSADSESANLGSTGSAHLGSDLKSAASESAHLGSGPTSPGSAGPTNSGSGSASSVSTITHRRLSSVSDSDGIPYGTNDTELIKYADFYYNNKFKKRYFKFNTVYQRRQFTNRFGDFELDWNEVEEHNPRSKNTKAKPRSCVYDREGLKWKIPLLGEL